MPHPDEGLIHAWLDGELDATESKRVESLVSHEPEWAAAAAEARGLIAASSRIVATLDHALPNAVPNGAPRRRTPRRWMIRAAALLVIVGGIGTVMRWRGLGPVLIEPPSREPRATRAEAATPGAPAPSLPTVSATPPGQQAPATGVGKKAIVPTTSSEAKQVATGASAARDLATAAPRGSLRAEVPVQNLAVTAESSRAAARGGVAGAAPSRLAQAPVASLASAREALKVEASNNPTTESGALKDHLAQRADTLTARSSLGAMALSARTTSCFEVRQPLKLAARILRLDAAQLADSIRLGTVALRGDTLVLAGSRELATKVSCPNP